MSATVICGDAADVLKGMPAESVHMCVTSPPYYALRSYLENGHKDKAKEIGLEQSPEEFIAKLVEVFREVKRVLRKEGTLWVNMGDSYASSWPCGRRNVIGNGSLPNGKREARPPRMGDGLKEKDLIGMPWALAFALRDDGWYLRQDIIWAKPSPMPESVRDRCTKAHEYIFLLAKSPRYYFDAEAIREEGEGYGPPINANGPGANFGRAQQASLRDKRENLRGAHGHSYEGGRNKRSVWQVPSAPYPEAHFATFPPALIEPCILAGTSAKGCCEQCGAPWRRVVERVKTGRGATASQLQDGIHDLSSARSLAQKRQAYRANGMEGPPPSTTTGWQPTCNCETESQPVPCTVLDPFAGSGTTGYVALQHDRRAVLIELNEDYIPLIHKRLEEVSAPLFAPVAPQPAPEPSLFPEEPS